MKLLGLVFAGCDTQAAHEKPARIRYHEGLQDLQGIWHGGDSNSLQWDPGEYRDCRSINLPAEENEPDLWCGHTTVADSGRVFNVRFIGGLTYDKRQQDGAMNYWRCQRTNDGSVAFVCTATSPPK
jgi:hypothetical protein